MLQRFKKTRGQAAICSPHVRGLGDEENVLSQAVDFMNNYLQGWAQIRPKFSYTLGAQTLATEGTDHASH